MPEVAVIDGKGAAGKPVALRDDVFGGVPNTALLHQAVLRQQADRRQGTHDSQTRAEVSRTTKKVWRQKGTGRARQGSRKGPHWSGGGTAFGPHPRSHNQDLPKKMRVAAIRSALSSKTAAGELILLDELTMKAPSTKELSQLLVSVVGKAGASVLLMLDAPQRSVHLSARNLPRVTTATTENINVYDLLRHGRVVMTVAAARRLEERYAKLDGSDAAATEPTEKPVRRRKPAAAKSEE